MNETAPPAIWPNSMLRAYGDMLTVDEISRILNIEPRKARELLTHPDASIRLPGVKIGQSWRIARDELCAYLVTHHNDDAPHDDAPHDDSPLVDASFSARGDERGTL